MRGDRQRLADIQEAIERIEKYAKGGRRAFERDELLQVWVVHHVRIIGEAARRLSGPFRSRHRDVPWAEIIAMRNILVHEYFGVDVDVVWATVRQDLPRLKARIRAILEGTGD